EHAFLKGWFTAAQSIKVREREDALARHAGRMRSPKQIRSLVDANCVSNSCREPVRIISAKGKFSSIAQRDRYGVEAGKIVKPAVRRQMKPPAIPPTNANGLASDNLHKPHSLADNAGSK